LVSVSCPSCPPLSLPAEFAIGNMVRRVLHMIREEAASEAVEGGEEGEGEGGARPSPFAAADKEVRGWVTRWGQMSRGRVRGGSVSAVSQSVSQLPYTFSQHHSSA
jgi:hypothetical protein